MALPKAVQQQLEEAEQLQKTVYETPADPASGDQPEVPTAPAEPAPTNVVELPTAAEPAKPEVPAVDPTQTVEYWKPRFETLQGKYNAEVPRFQAQIRQQAEQIADLQREITELKRPVAPPEDSPVTQKDIDDFGKDLIDAMTRVARAEARSAYAAERAELEKKFGAVDAKVGQVAEQVVQSETEKFWGKVMDLVPNWLQIDANPAWISWLDTTPEYSDVTYRILASQAINNGKPDKIAKLVATWQKETGQASPPSAVPPAAPPAQPSSELSRQVAPSTVKSGSVPVTQKVLTRAEYESLYDVRNVQRFGEKRANEMIAEADAAVAEGRVRWT